MIAIINYGMGNLTSILNMCKRLGIEAMITKEKELIESADHLVLPGVGHFKRGMDNLQSTGLQAVLNKIVLEDKKPILGICLGAQLMTRHSEEGNIEGLGWMAADTILFNTSRVPGLKVPHMGWADISIKDQNPLWSELPRDPRFYHVHAYHFLFDDPGYVSATAYYGYEFVTAFHRGNIYGCQFHPEKSHKYGMKVLQNFANTR